MMFITSFIYTVDQARTVQLVYIDNRDYPGGPWAWFLASQSLAINVVFYATFFLMTFFADALVVRTFGDLYF